MSDTNKQKVLFWRGKELKTNPDGNTNTNGEIIFLNDAMGDATTDENYEFNKKLGSIYQDDKIVGTTRAEQLMTTKSITIAGGPLANEVKDEWPSDWKESGKNVIPKGVSLQNILEKLFLKEIYPSTTSTGATYSLSVGAPTSTLTVSGTVEVGTEVSLNDVTISSGTSASSTVPKVTGLTYGYKTSKTVNKTNSTTIEGSVSSAVDSNSNYELSITIDEGFTGNLTTYSDSQEAGDKNDGWEDVKINKQSLGYVEDGENKLTITSTGATYTFTPTEVESVYIVSNIDNVDDNKKTTKTSTTATKPTAPTNTLELSVTGARFMFLGGFETAKDSLTSNDIRGLGISQKSESTTIDVPFSSSNLTKHIVIALPTSLGLKITKVVNRDVMDTNITDVFNKKTTSVNVLGTNNYSGVEYDIWEYKPNSPWTNTIGVTIGK